MHARHDQSGTMFFAEINKNAVSCWNMKSPLRAANMGEVARDNVTLIYPTDLNVRRWQICGRVSQETGRKEIENKISSSSFPPFVSIQVIDDDLYVLSNRMIRHLYSKLIADDYNFRIFRTSVKNAVAGTNCEVTKKRSRRRGRRFN